MPVSPSRKVRSPNQPKLRRKAPILEETTALQRLVEYFVIVSSEPRWDQKAAASPADGSPKQKHARKVKTGNIHMPDQRPRDHTFSPIISARYPTADHSDNPLNPMILQFCYPTSDVIVPSTKYEMPRFHYFVLTNDKGRKVYGTCLTIMEEYVAEGPWKSKGVAEEESASGIELSVCEKVLYIPKVLCLLSTWPYLSAFREYLSQLYKLATATNCMTAPIERYIVNVCMEIPAPPPGAYQVQVNILDSTIRFWAPPAKLPIAFVGVPFQILFDCLDVEHILQVWSALMVERKVLLLSSQYSILTVCAEILCSLLFPLRWSHLYVPLLPRMLCPMLDAPVPYLCGVVRETWHYAREHVSSDTIVVDLDHNQVKWGAQTPELPPLPPRKYSKLQATLMESVGHVFWRTRGLEKEYRSLARKGMKKSTAKLRVMVGRESRWREKLSGLDNAFNLAYTPDSHLLQEFSSTSDEYAQSQWDQVQEGFLRFFVAVLKDYQRFLIMPSVAETRKPAVRPSFDRIAFLASQKMENVTFLMEFCMTQQFDDFITKRLYSPGEPDLVFFDQSIDAKMNRSKLKLKKVETPFLQSAKTHKDLTKFQALPPNEDGLSDYSFERILKPYVYKTFPETLKEELFSQPRPLPRMIAAEFDRQAMLVQRLMADGDEKDEAVDLLEFYGGDYDPSPEVAAFTVFLFAYSAIVGQEWQKFESRQKSTDSEDKDMDEREASEGSAAVRGGGDVLEHVDRDAANGCLEDLSMGLCHDCSDSGVSLLRSTLLYVGEGAEEAYSSLFSKAADQMASLRSSTAVEQTSETSEYEEAREVASAQLDLGFEALASMRLRGLSADSDAYKSLMEACGRCGDTERALSLMKLMKDDGFVADSEVLSCFVAAFAHDSASGLGIDIGAESPIVYKESSTPIGSDAYSYYLNKKFAAAKGENPALHAGTTCESPFVLQASISSDDSASYTTASTRSMNFLDLFVPQKFDRRRARKQKIHADPTTRRDVTEMLSTQIALGESLLEYLYPQLVIDTGSDSCPHCSNTLSENDVVKGWLPSSFHDYTTQCPKCRHRFVPRFVVNCSAPSFEGSQGVNTPLYCEFLSPWVLRKALQHVIKNGVGIEGMLQPEWRNGTDIRATLFWNMIVLCHRFKLPCSFLLQGSFQSRVILPRRPNHL